MRKTRIRYRGLLGLFAAAALAAAPASGAGEGEGGEIALFDGKTLDGWAKASGPPVSPKYLGGEWKVDGGAIVARQLPDLLGSFLHTAKEFRDFEISIDVNPDWGCDSGIWLRTNEKGECIQVFLDYLPEGNVGFVYGQGTGGFSSMPWRLEAVMEGEKVVGVKAVDKYDGVAVDGLLFASKAADFNRVWKHGEFNTLKIRCAGSEPRITTWINGEKMMEMDGATFKARGLMQMRKADWSAKPAWDAAAVRKKLGDDGWVALQIHPGLRWSGAVRYKNIRIRPIQNP